MAWGSGATGITPWGGDGAVANLALRLLEGEAVRENVIRLTFSDPVYFSRWHDPADASFIDRYAVAEVPTSVGLDGNAARPVAPALVELVPGDGTQIDLWLDRAMSPFGAQYTVSVHGLQSQTGLLIDADAAAVVVDGVTQGLPRLTPDELVGNRDIANPQTLSAISGTATTVALGVYQYDDTGDVGIDAGLVSYKKRVFRRLTTRKGAYAHMPSYGVTIPQSIKKLARANLVGGIAADAEDQIRQEPETTDVSVQLVPHPEAPGLYVYRISVATTIGQLQNFDVPVPLAA